jgi:hypothetical protein
VNPSVALPVVIAAAAVVVVPAAIARRQWALAVGFCAAGAGVALQAPPLYALVDPLLGGRNLTNLVYHLLTVIGIGAFMLLVLAASPTRDRRARGRRAVVVATGVACVLQAGLFVAGSTAAGWGGLDAHLTEAIASPLFVGYASVLWVALAGLACAAIVTQHAQTSGRPWSIARIGTSLVVIGCVVALVWCANAITRAIAAVSTGTDGAPDRVGPALALAGGAAVFLGLALTNLPHVTARIRAAALDLTTRALWRRAVASAPEVVLPSTTRASLGGRATLYRRWVEIEDAVRLGRLDLTDQERERIATMQRMFAPARPARLHVGQTR